METFFWICAALIVIGLPTFGMLITYGSLKSVKEDIKEIQSLENKIYNLESDCRRLEMERDDIEIKRDHAIQEKEYTERGLKFLEDYSYKHTSVVNSIHRGILDRIYGQDKTSYLSVLVNEHGPAADYDHEDEYKIIERFIKKYPNPTKRSETR